MKSGKIMKTLIKLLMILFVISMTRTILSETRQSREVKYNPEIKSALVYPDRAMITRSEVLLFNKGKYKLIFKNASPNLRPKSLRAFSDNPDCIIQGINSYLERKIDTINPELRKLEREYEKFEDQRDELLFNKDRFKNDLKGLKKYRKYLARIISKLSAHREQSDADPSAWAGAGQFIIKRWLETKRMIRETDEGLFQIREKMEILKNRVTKISSSGSKQVRIVEMILQSSRPAATARISFSYIIPNASWHVSYGLYLQRDNRILVEYYGNIRQQTGEDWQNITLKLSTSTPSHGAKRPAIYPVTVKGRKLQTKETFAQFDKKLSDEESIEKEKPGESKDLSLDRKDKFAALEDTGRSLVFRIKLPAIIPSSNETHRVTIDRFVSPRVELGLRVTPSRQKVAHLTASFYHKEGYPLLRGRADIYRYSDFMGRSTIDHTPPGSYISIGFGVERSIKLRREVFHHRETRGVLSKNKVFQTDLETWIENHSNEKKKISFYERIPVSQVEEIQVRILPETSPGYVIKQKDSGILKWEVTIPPKDKKKIRLKYQALTPFEFTGFILGR